MLGVRFVCDSSHQTAAPRPSTSDGQTYRGLVTLLLEEQRAERVGGDLGLALEEDPMPEDRLQEVAVGCCGGGRRFLHLPPYLLMAARGGHDDLGAQTKAQVQRVVCGRVAGVLVCVCGKGMEARKEDTLAWSRPRE